jgi:hypothetical protein
MPIGAGMTYLAPFGAAACLCVLGPAHYATEISWLRASTSPAHIALALPRSRWSRRSSTTPWFGLVMWLAFVARLDGGDDRPAGKSAVHRCDRMTAFMLTRSGSLGILLDLIVSP